MEGGTQGAWEEIGDHFRRDGWNKRRHRGENKVKKVHKLA